MPFSHPAIFLLLEYLITHDDRAHFSPLALSRGSFVPMPLECVAYVATLVSGVWVAFDSQTDIYLSASIWTHVPEV